MDTLEKSLKNLSQAEKFLLKRIIQKILDNDLSELNIKKLRGFSHIYRARKGRLRIVFQILPQDIIILKIDRRSEDTYKNL